METRLLYSILGLYRDNENENGDYSLNPKPPFFGSPNPKGLCRYMGYTWALK